MTPEEAIRAASTLLNERRASGRLIVGIDGAGGAGKSTLAEGIRQAFVGRVSIIRCDDFYRPIAEHEIVALDPQAGYEEYFDWKRLRDEALIPLRDGSPAKYRRYDWSTDRLAEWIVIESREIILIEGVYSTRPELRQLLDVAIFIDTPREERLRRMRARPQENTSWIKRWMAAEDWSLENIAPQHHADLVIEGF
ncbi:MAG TPA: AAA family ATPase [Candidatus Binataceae bacterium]|nr:AAA family ATPase [Candidatus Binataceae bacterium]